MSEKPATVEKLFELFCKEFRDATGLHATVDVSKPTSDAFLYLEADDVKQMIDSISTTFMNLPYNDPLFAVPVVKEVDGVGVRTEDYIVGPDRDAIIADKIFKWPDHGRKPLAKLDLKERTDLLENMCKALFSVSNYYFNAKKARIDLASVADLRHLISRLAPNYLKSLGVASVDEMYSILPQNERASLIATINTILVLGAAFRNKFNPLSVITGDTRTSLCDIVFVRVESAMRVIKLRLKLEKGTGGRYVLYDAYRAKAFETFAHQGTLAIRTLRRGEEYRDNRQLHLIKEDPVEAFYWLNLLAGHIQSKTEEGSISLGKMMFIWQIDSDRDYVITGTAKNFASSISEAAEDSDTYIPPGVLEKYTLYDGDFSEEKIGAKIHAVGFSINDMLDYFNRNARSSVINVKANRLFTHLFGKKDGQRFYDAIKFYQRGGLNYLSTIPYDNEKIKTQKLPDDYMKLVNGNM